MRQKEIVACGRDFLVFFDNEERKIFTRYDLYLILGSKDNFFWLPINGFVCRCNKIQLPGRPGKTFDIKLIDLKFPLMYFTDNLNFSKDCEFLYHRYVEIFDLSGQVELGQIESDRLSKESIECNIKLSTNKYLLSESSRLTKNKIEDMKGI